MIRVSRWLRRDVLKSSVVLPVAARMGLPGMAAGAEAAAEPGPQGESNGENSRLRERLLLDFGWRFHLGNADDPAKDFGFENGRNDYGGGKIARSDLGDRVSFRAGRTTYTGRVFGDRIELNRETPPFRLPGAIPSREPAGPRPAVGPPPDGTDPSFGPGFGGGRGRPQEPLILRRVER